MTEAGLRAGRAAHGRAAWYLARARAMGPAELALRARRELAARVDDALYRHARPVWRRAWYPDADGLLAEPPLLERPLGLPVDEAPTLLAGMPHETARLAEAAERAAAGRARYLGYPEVVLDDPPDWSLDPYSGRRWPDRHGKLLDYRRAEFGDPKWIWELNRCQELPLLAAASRLAGGSRLGRAAADRLLAWTSTVRPGRGIAWSNGFEAGLRAISFALCLDALRGTDVLDPEEAVSVLRSLRQHARFALRDLSPASSANNHLAGELAGVATVGLLAPELRESDGFRRVGLEGLAGVARSQILPDGTGAEQAFGYHLFVVDLLLLVAALAERRGVEAPAEIGSALRRAADAIALQVAGDEPDPAYGDADDGRAFVLDGAAGRDARGVAAALGACLGHPGAASLADRPDPAALLLFGAAGRERLERARTEGDPDPGSAVLPDSGLVVLRREGVRALFDAGPLGYLSLAAHGHADALQLTLCDGEQELVSDPGTGSYYGDRSRRSAFRSTSLHATVAVDGRDQAEQAGPFLWRRHYSCALLACDPGEGVVVAEHDGYLRLADPVRHRRAVLGLTGGSFLVYDRLDASGTHRYVSTWPLHPRLEADAEGYLVEATRDGVPRLLVASVASAPGDLVLRRGETAPPAGWTSRRLEQADPSWTVQHTVECRGGVRFATLLLVARGRVPAEPELRLAEEGGVATISFVLDGAAQTVAVDLDDARRPVQVLPGVEELQR